MARSTRARTAPQPQPEAPHPAPIETTAKDNDFTRVTHNSRRRKNKAAATASGGNQPPHARAHKQGNLPAITEVTIIRRGGHQDPQMELSIRARPPDAIVREVRQNMAKAVSRPIPLKAGSQLYPSLGWTRLLVHGVPVVNNDGLMFGPQALLQEVHTFPGFRKAFFAMALRWLKPIETIWSTYSSVTFAISDLDGSITNNLLHGRAALFGKDVTVERCGGAHKSEEHDQKCTCHHCRDVRCPAWDLFCLRTIQKPNPKKDKGKERKLANELSSAQDLQWEWEEILGSVNHGNIEDLLYKEPPEMVAGPSTPRPRSSVRSSDPQPMDYSPSCPQELWFDTIGTARNASKNGVDILGGVASPMWELLYPSHTNMQCPKTMAYIRKHGANSLSHPKFTVAAHTDICAHPCIQVLDIWVNNETWRVVNFYHDICDSTCLPALLGLDVDVITPTMLLGDFNTHSPTWSPPDVPHSSWANRVEEWATTNLLSLANTPGWITRRGADHE
ncbi:hypothetical protein BC827DRAFT_1158869 [Russula dissimulans]|nr:hypothetical protein BC827DRAFT_1158869 [Russula dissimulans]